MSVVLVTTTVMPMLPVRTLMAPSRVPVRQATRALAPAVKVSITQSHMITAKVKQN